ncbi:MAG: hypothetical protein JWQ49_5985 [Edaphobacter sp.]|nr:hypothetical protein [Edaphobacter sp.]
MGVDREPGWAVGSDLGCCDAFDDDALGFKVSDPMICAVAQVNRLLEKCDERARGFGKPAVVGLVPIYGQVVGCVAFGAGEGCFNPTMEGAGRELADGF